MARVRFVGRWDRSTRRMISSFSEAGYLMRRSPHPRSCFFEQAVLERQIGYRLLKGGSRRPQLFHLGRRDLTRRVTGQPLLPGLKEFLRPAVIEARRDPLVSAELGDAVFASQALQNDADLLFSRMLLPCAAPDVLHDGLGGRFGWSGFQSPRSVPLALTPDTRQPIGGAAIGMERPRRIDDDIIARKQVQIVPPIQPQRRATQFIGQELRLVRVAPGHGHRMPVTDQKLGQACAEDTIAAEDQNLHRKSLF